MHRSTKLVVEKIRHAFLACPFPLGFPKPVCGNLGEMSGSILRLRPEYFPCVLSNLLCLSLTCNQGKEYIDSIIDILDLDGVTILNGEECIAGTVVSGVDISLIKTAKGCRFQYINNKQALSILEWLRHIKMNGLCPWWRQEELGAVISAWERRS